MDVGSFYGWECMRIGMEFGGFEWKSTVYNVVLREEQ